MESIEERFAYYVGREDLLGNLVRYLPLALGISACAAGLTIDFRVGNPLDPVYSWIGPTASLVAFLFFLYMAARGFSLERRMDDLARQLYEVDAFIKSGGKLEPKLELQACRYFNMQFLRVGAYYRRIAREDGIYPVVFPMDETAEAGLRMAVRQSRPGRSRRYVASFPITIVSLIFMWTFAEILVWSNAPQICTLGQPECPGAYQGLAEMPRLSDFLYLTLNSLVANMPPDVAARSSTAHAVFVGIVVSGVLVTSVYLPPALRSLREDMPAVPDFESEGIHKSR